MAKQIQIQPPLKGLDEVSPLTEFDPNYATDVLNVRPFELGRGRQAIAQRPGLGKWASLPAGVDVVRVIKQIDITGETTATFWADDFAGRADGVYTVNANQTQAEFDAASVGLYGYDYTMSSHKATEYGPSSRMFFYYKLPNDNFVFRFKWVVGTGTGIFTNLDQIVLFIGNDSLFGTPTKYRFLNIFHGSGGHAGNVGIYCEFGKADLTETDSTDFSGTAFSPGDTVDIVIDVNPARMIVTVGANTPVTFNTPGGYGPYSNLTGSEKVMCLKAEGAGPPTLGRYYNMSLTTTSIQDTAKVAIIDGTTFLTWSWDDGFVAATGGPGAVHNSNDVCIQPAFGKAYIVDQQHFLVYDPITNIVSAAVATAGSLPTGYGFSCLFQGRLFLFYNREDPGNWFTSKLGDPLNFDTATGLSTSAVVGNNSNAGAMAEAMTAAIPWADNWLVMASANELHVLRGSPKTGSRDLISNQVGIVGPRAWCQLPNGSIVFTSRHGLYSLAPGGQPQPISSQRVRTFIDSIDFSATTIEMAWDLGDQCVYVAARPYDVTAVVKVLVWNVRNDSFWVDEYPQAQGPSALGSVLFKADRIMLFGGRDGYIRSPNPASYDDDGTQITSRVRFAPIILGDGNTLGRVLKARMNWGSGIANSRFGAQYRYHAADTAGLAAASTAPAHVRDVMLGTYQSIDRERVRGGALALEIVGQNKPDGTHTTWSFESGSFEVVPAGRIRSTVGPDADLQGYGVPEGQIGGFTL